MPHGGHKVKESYANCRGPRPARTALAVQRSCHIAILTCVSQTATDPHPQPRGAQKKSEVNVHLVLPTLKTEFFSSLSNNLVLASSHTQGASEDAQSILSRH